MTTIGLTGGIGAGKTYVASLLAIRGAWIVSADRIVHDLQERGKPVFDAIVERFGPGVLTASGELDRPALASLVFDDPAARRELEAIVHPAVGLEMARRRAELEERGEIVVLDIPLLAEAGADAKARWNLDAVIVVDCPIDVAVDRLVRLRGMTEEDARARVAAQVSREERLANADFVLDNSKDLDHLGPQIMQCWEWIQSL